MAKLYSREKAQKLREEALGKDVNTIGEKMARQLIDHFNQLHSINNRRMDKDIELLLLRQMEHEITMIDSKPDYPRDLVKFNPSGANKCALELYQKAIGIEEQEDDRYPYHVRWTRNSTAVHGAVQRDLLYAEKLLPYPLFTVERTADGLPAWEDNILTYKIIEHQGVKFVLNGKMDGILNYTPEGIRVGFEYKTKTNSIGQVGHYKMKEASESHKQQCIAYFLLFGIRHYIIFYEGIAKDGWSKGAEAKPDIRAFHFYVTDELANQLLDKWAYVVKCVEAGVEPPQELDKCLFCNFKYICHAEGGQVNG
jgi:hypothetical protein